MSLYPWSFSRLENYFTCPRQYYAKYVAKTAVEEESEAIIWGNTVHKNLELRLSEGRALDKEVAMYEPIAARIASSPGDLYCELKLAVTVDLQPTEFFAGDAWHRGIEDIVIVNGSTAMSGDWKTGKKKPKSEQLVLSAGRVFAKFPKVDTVHTSFFWLKDYPNNWTTKSTFKRSEFMPQWEKFREKVSELEWSYKNNAWPAKPSGLCKAWCPDLTCPHNGKRRR